MRPKSLSLVSAIALSTGLASLTNCSSHPAAKATGGSTSASASSSGAGGGGGAPAPFEPNSPAVYVAKVKNLLIGKAPTDAEIQTVTSDPTQLKTLIDTWMMDPAYDLKMRVFFELNFQQTQINATSFIDMVPPAGLAGTGVPLLVQNITESFARTVVELNHEGKPFTEAITTKTFMMTPALMEFYAFLDTYHADDLAKTTDNLVKYNPTATGIEQGTNNFQNITLMQSVTPGADFLHFYDPDVATLTYTTNPSCNGIDPVVYKPSSYILNRILYGEIDNHMGPSGNCGNRASKNGMVFDASDFAESAWRMVTIRPPKTNEATTRFFDIPTLRTLNELVINTPRVGFFSTPAFFANWSTNSSNQMRVTLNQALIVATGMSVDGTDGTNPPSTPALDSEHAMPGTQCYGCHQLLDPSRAILSATWTYPYYTQLDPTQTSQKGLFAFQGVINTNLKTIDDFANTLATHPLFPAAWVQKLCYYANSEPCSTNDPEFQRIVGVFKSSNYSWNTLVRELMASPLTTYATAPTPPAQRPEVVAVARRDHLCAALNNRLGLVDVCGLDVTSPPSTIQSIVAGLPSDGYGRGSPIPVLPNAPTLFYRAGLENICEGVAKIVIDNPSPPMGAMQWKSSATPSSAISDFVSIVMAVESSDARSAPMQAALESHFTSAVAQGASTTTALQSTFTVACLAASAAGIGM